MPGSWFWNGLCCACHALPEVASPYFHDWYCLHLNPRRRRRHHHHSRRLVYHLFVSHWGQSHEELSSHTVETNQLERPPKNSNIHTT